ncbi:retrovirus-related pol polyprotein from transposon TNT 1-94 [Tanacetum coccineum]
MSSKCNNVKLVIRNDKSEVVCAMCKQCLITMNHDVCVLNYVNGMNSREDNQSESVSNVANLKKHKPKVKKSNKLGSKEGLASPKPSKPRSCLRCSKGCSNHMTGNLKLLINFVWKFLGTVHFGYDHIAAILGYGDLQRGNILITRVYFVEGLGHNMFSVGQFYDLDLDVAFRRNTCFVRNLEEVDLLKENHTINLCTINLHQMAYASPICLMALATSTKSWLWHQRLSHLNFDTINNLAKNDLVTGLPKLKYHKEHLCPSCESKDEAPKEIKTFLKKITVLLQAPVIIIITNNGTEFKNQMLKEYFDSVGTSYQSYFVRTPPQNGVVERRNRTLVEAARTMLIFSCGLLFLWDQAIATACYTQNPPSFTNDREDIGKLGAKGNIGFFIGYSINSRAYRVYNRRTEKIIEMMNITFDELSAMAFEQRNSKPGLQSMTSG